MESVIVQVEGDLHISGCGSAEKPSYQRHHRTVVRNKSSTRAISGILFCHLKELYSWIKKRWMREWPLLFMHSSLEKKQLY